MATNQKRAGLIQVSVDGVRIDAKGNFTYNIGLPQREGIVGSDGVHGFKETPQVPFIEGEITDRKDLDLEALLRTNDATVVLQLGNGKVIALRNAWFAGEGTGNTEEANVAVRFEGLLGEEVS